MKRESRGLVWSRRVARWLSRVYPRRFRDEHGESFEVVAERRWRREVESGRSAVSATVRVLLHLVADAMVSAEEVWRHEIVRERLQGGGWRTMNGWLSERWWEAKLTVRSLARRPLFGFGVVLTLGLGIGVSAAVFGALDRLVLRPLPYPAGDRMALLTVRHPELGWEFSPPNGVVERWRGSARTVERIEVFRPVSVVQMGGGQATMRSGVLLSAGLPSMLGVRPVTGRMLGAADADPSSSPAILVSEAYWRRELGGTPDVSDRTLTLNDTVFTVAGVWPASARLIPQMADADFYRVVPAGAESPDGDFALVLALLRKGVSVADAEAELTGLMEGVEGLPVGVRAAVVPPYGLLGDEYVRGLWLVFAAGLVLMMVAVANAVNLMLGRVTFRTSEMGVRLALGGSIDRLAQLFLTESALLSAAGIGLGLVIAHAMGELLSAFGPGSLVPAGATAVGARSLGFAVLLSAAAALICGLVPLAWIRGAGVRTLVALGGEGRGTAGTSRMRMVLVGAQSALAVLLVSGATLLGRSFGRLSSVDTGMDLEHLVEISIRAPEQRYPDEASQAVFAERVRETLAAVPGVSALTTSPVPPLSYSVRAANAYLEGEVPPVEAATLPDLNGRGGSGFVAVTGAPAGWFDVLGIPIVAGRGFEPDETGVAVVNQAFARKRGGDVLGRTLAFTNDSVRYTIIGVAGDVRALGLRDDPERIQIYYPSSASGVYTRFLLRANGSADLVLANAKAALARAEPDVPLRESRTGQAIMRAQTSRSRFVAALLAMYALLGVAFAVTGVYGAVSLDVSRRTREMGVRSALGATGRDLAAMIIRVGLRPVLPGCVAGILIALFAARRLGALLYQVSPADPASLVVAVGLLVATGIVGSLVPAVRAARVDPNRALRAD